MGSGARGATVDCSPTSLWALYRARCCCCRAATSSDGPFHQRRVPTAQRIRLSAVSPQERM